MIAHEKISSGPAIVASSDRAFGLALGAFLSVAGSWPMLHARPPRAAVLGVAALVFLIAIARPALLSPVHKISIRIAMVLHAVTSPVLMAILFYGLLTPCGLLMRLFGRKPLDTGAADSYWHPRDPGAAESMKVPF